MGKAFICFRWKSIILIKIINFRKRLLDWSLCNKWIFCFFNWNTSSWLERRRIYRSRWYIFIYNTCGCCDWRNLFIRRLWRIWIKCYWSINITNYNNSTNWLGFKLGSSTIYFGIINHTNGGSLRKIPSYKKPNIKENFYDKIKLWYGRKFWDL